MPLTREHKKSLTDRVYFPSEETLKLAQRNVHFTHLKKKRERERKNGRKGRRGKRITWQHLELRFHTKKIRTSKLF